MKKKDMQHLDANLWRCNHDLSVRVSNAGVPAEWFKTHTVGVDWKIGASNHVHAPASRDIGIGEGPKTIVYAEVSIEEPIAEENASRLPPAMGEALVVLFCAKNRVDAVLGDLTERFVEESAVKGERRAKLLFWARVLRSIWPLLWAKIRNGGFLAMLFEIGRRLIGS